MKGVRPEISPEAIQSNLQARGTRSRDLEHTIGDPKSDISCDDLDTGDPLSNLSSFLGSQGGPVGSIAGMKCTELLARSVGEGFCSAEVREEVTVALENIEFVCCGLFIVASKGPGTGGGGGVFRSEFESTDSDSEIKVTKDELDSARCYVRMRSEKNK